MAKTPIQVESLTHKDATRRNIPTAEFESLMTDQDKTPIELAYQRRNRDLDPQLVWRGKDEQNESDLIVQAPPLYIQEKVHPKVLIDDLKRETDARRANAQSAPQFDMFADFNGLPDLEAKTEFYAHDQHWSNRMISGDSLSVMASLAEREGLKGKVQCIYFDPPYGIKFNSNFQWSTTTPKVKDGKLDNLTREPEQVRAFRDTWRDGIHSYLTYLRDRLIVARDLLHESGSIFVQIGDENVHRVRALMDEVFGEENFVSQIFVKKTTGAGSPAKLLSPPEVGDYLVWYSKSGKERMKYREQFMPKEFGGEGSTGYKNFELKNGFRTSIANFQKGKNSDFDYISSKEIGKVYALDNLTSQAGGEDSRLPISFEGKTYKISSGSWKTSSEGIQRLKYARKIDSSSKGNLGYIRYFEDFPAMPILNVWTDTVGQNQFGPMGKVYVVQTAEKAVQRCILMTTDPGDLVLDPTCGSGTTAYVAEQWGRRWITIDTSRVSLALARSRIMGARYPYYLLADSVEGQKKEGEITRTIPKTTAVQNNIRHGFVYERVPHITLKSIANNSEIDVIYDKFQEILEPLRAQLNSALGTNYEEWEIPREIGNWDDATKQIHAKWWEARINRQKEIDASIAAKADSEYLYDKPYSDNKRVRVAGPFTVESLSPHRTLAVDWDDELLDPLEQQSKQFEPGDRAQDFAAMIIENLKNAGVQQSNKEDKINFTSLVGWPGEYLCAHGKFFEGDKEKSAGILIGPEFGTISRQDLVTAAREAGDAGFDVIIACAFNYDAHSAEFEKLGRVQVLKARMNPDLHMAQDLKNTGTGNLFVIFGEPDIQINELPDNMLEVVVHGVDVFKPQTGEVESSGTDGIALWMLDTDYNEESFFVRHAYFLGANDPYKALKTSLKTEIDVDAWQTLHSDTSRPFAKPKSGRIAVKVINHLGDEVMKVFRV